MTKQESFKRRVRDRMAKTGERYGAARRMLLTGGDPAAAHTAGRSAQLVARPRASEPEMSDAAIQAGTGRTWDEWCNLIDARLGSRVPLHRDIRRRAGRLMHKVR